MSFLKSIFKGKQHTPEDLTLLEQHTCVARYVISTHLIAMGEKVNVFDIDGSPLLPYMDAELTNKGYENVIAHHVPIIMYNALSVEDFPANDEFNIALANLEQAIRENMHNPWVIRLVKSYEHNRPIKKEELLKLDSSEILKYEFSRGGYDVTCGKWVKAFEKECKNKAVKKKLIDWFNKKYNDLTEN